MMFGMSVKCYEILGLKSIQLGVNCVASVPCAGHLDGVQGNSVLSLCRRRRQPAEGLGHQVQSRDSSLHQQEVSKPCLQLDPTAIVYERRVLPCPFPSHGIQRWAVTVESCFCLPWEMETSVRLFRQDNIRLKLSSPCPST